MNVNSQKTNPVARCRTCFTTFQSDRSNRYPHHASDPVPFILSASGSTRRSLNPSGQHTINNKVQNCKRKPLYRMCRCVDYIPPSACLLLRNHFVTTAMVFERNTLMMVCTTSNLYRSTLTDVLRHLFIPRYTVLTPRNIANIAAILSIVTNTRLYNLHSGSYPNLQPFSKTTYQQCLHTFLNVIRPYTMWIHRQ
jgi:hypothetical protein